MKATQFILATVAVMAMSSGLFFVMENTSNMPNVPAQVHILYSKWRVKFGVLRATPAEYKFRLTVFNKKFNSIKMLREKYPETQFSLNGFADMTLEELNKNFLGFEADPSPQTEEEKIALDKINSEESLDLPSSYRITSLRAIKYQGQCGSCWAFGGAAVAETVKGGSIDISEQHIINCNSRARACSGGNMYADAFESLINKGYKSNSQVPYQNEAGRQNCQAGSSWSYGRVRERGDFSGSGAFSLTKTRQHVNDYNEAVGVAVYVKGNAFYGYRGGNFNPTECSGDVANHAMNLVGWNGNVNELRNSWNTWWGDQGYMFVYTESRCICGGAGMYCIAHYIPK